MSVEVHGIFWFKGLILTNSDDILGNFFIPSPQSRTAKSDLDGLISDNLRMQKQIFPWPSHVDIPPLFVEGRIC
jgi:hypothetical protein